MLSPALSTTRYENMSTVGRERNRLALGRADPAANTFYPEEYNLTEH